MGLGIRGRTWTGCRWSDIIAVNLDHYRLDADFKHGLHFTALPTAWVSGFDKTSTLRIGSSTAWVAETPGATAGFLEFTGQGLTTFERAMDRDERLMAVLGLAVAGGPEEGWRDGAGDRAAAERREQRFGQPGDERERVADAGPALGLLVELD